MFNRPILISFEKQMTSSVNSAQLFYGIDVNKRMIRSMPYNNPMLFQCQATVPDGSPTLSQHCMAYRYCYSTQEAQTVRWKDSVQTRQLAEAIKISLLRLWSLGYHSRRQLQTSADKFKMGFCDLLDRGQGSSFHRRLRPGIIQLSPAAASRRLFLATNRCRDCWVYIEGHGCRTCHSITVRPFVI